MEEQIFQGRKSAIMATAIFLSLVPAVPAGANLVINPTFDSTITSDPNCAGNRVCNQCDHRTG